MLCCHFLWILLCLVVLDTHVGMSPRSSNIVVQGSVTRRPKKEREEDVEEDGDEDGDVWSVVCSLKRFCECLHSRLHVCMHARVCLSVFFCVYLCVVERMCRRMRCMCFFGEYACLYVCACAVLRVCGCVYVGVFLCLCMLVCAQASIFFPRLDAVEIDTDCIYTREGSTVA